MTPPSLKIHCPCLDPNSLPPPPKLPSSSHSYHEIHDLYFCEECDSIRCNRCVSVEVSGYYCPNCLFEVPSASVRGEKNRCARNCFLCPSCKNTLIVVPSDPPESADGRITSANTLGDPPFFLYCSHCRWDSAEVGITFEKPTSLATQLQKYEDSAPDSLEFERLKEHFEPFIRASSASSSASHHLRTAQHVHSNPITAAASDALSRDVPGVSKYNPLSRSRVGRDKPNRDEMPDYRSRMDISLTGSDSTNVEHLMRIEGPEEVATLEQRWINSWTSSVLANDLKPLRIPLHSRKSKRCPTCRHILIKPEQKPQSVRFKIKISATSYLPLMALSLPFLNNPTTTPKRPIRPGAMWEEDKNSNNPVMAGGRTYPFVLSFTNPMYDPIQIRLNVLRSPPPDTTAQGDESGTTQPEKRRPPFAVSLPTHVFTVAAFAEAWEYDDEDDEMVEDEYVDLVDDRRHPSASTSSGTTRGGKTKTVCVLEKKANTTYIGGEVVISKEAQGDVKFLMMVTFTYRNDTVDDVDMGDENGPGDGSPVRTTNPSNSALANANKQPEIRTFSYYVVVELGKIAQRNWEGSVDERR